MFVFFICTLLIILLVIAEFINSIYAFLYRKSETKSEVAAKRAKLFLAAVVLLIVVSIPIVLYVEATRTNLKAKVGNIGDWIGFWGSYLGSSMGVVGAVGISYWTTKKQLEESRHQLEVQLEESRKNELNNAIELNDIKVLNKMIKATSDSIYHFEELKKNFEEIDYIKKDNYDPNKRKISDVEPEIKNNLIKITDYKQFIVKEINELICDNKSITDNWTKVKDGISKCDYGTSIESANEAIKNGSNFVEELKCVRKGNIEQFHKPHDL